MLEARERKKKGSWCWCGWVGGQIVVSGEPGSALRSQQENRDHAAFLLMSRTAEIDTPTLKNRENGKKQVTNTTHVKNRPNEDHLPCFCITISVYTHIFIYNTITEMCVCLKASHLVNRQQKFLFSDAQKHILL